MSSPSHVARLTQQFNARVSTSSPPSPGSGAKRKTSPSHGLRLSVVTSSDIQDGTGSVSSDNSNVTSNTDCDISSTTSSTHHVPTHILSASSSASNHTFLEADSIEDGTPFVSIDLPFDPFAQSAETMMKVALEVFALSGVMERYQIPQDRLTRFLEQVRDTYHAKNPYHNWQHAVHVLVNSFRFIQERIHLLDPLHVFGLLVSAVCHDADHSGLTNRHHAQEHGASNIGSPVGLTPYFGSGRKLPPRSPMGTNPSGILRRTGSASISISSDQKTPSLVADDYLHYLEKNSIRRACEILERDEYDILAALNEDDREMMYDIMEDLILCTDVSDPAMVKDCRERWLSHQDICDLRLPLATAPGDLVRAFNRDLSMMILLCADIGVVIEPFPIYISCVRALFYETRVHSNCLPNEYCKRQIGFLNGYGRELYETFARVGPLVPACNVVDRLISNRTQFEKELATRHGAYRLMGYGEPETREEDETEEATSSARNSVVQPNSPGLSRATEGLRLSDASAPIPPLPVNRPSITAQTDLNNSSSPRILTITTAATGSLNASMSPEADPGTGSNLAKRRYMRHTITVPLNTNTGS